MISNTRYRGDLLFAIHMNLEAALLVRPKSASIIGTNKFAGKKRSAVASWKCWMALPLIISAMGSFVAVPVETPPELLFATRITAGVFLLFLRT
jgi:hypothetical protein